MELENIARIFSGGEWGIGFSTGILSLSAPSQKEALNLALLEPEALAKWAHKFGKAATLIGYPGGESYRIPAAMAESDLRVTGEVKQAISQQQEDSKMARGIITKAELDWNALASGVNPVYVSTMKEQDNLYVNAAVIQAQSGKPAKSLLNDTAHSLNSDEELQNRCGYVARGENLIEYQYEALRWFKDAQTGIWIRRGMTFTSNILGIQYLGEPCWIEEVLDAVPLAYHVDNATR